MAYHLPRFARIMATVLLSSPLALHPAGDSHSNPAPIPPTTLPFTVCNRLVWARSAETVSLPAARLASLMGAYGADNLRVRDATGAVLVR